MPDICGLNNLIRSNIISSNDLLNPSISHLRKLIHVLPFLVGCQVSKSEENLSIFFITISVPLTTVSIGSSAT